MSLVWTRHRYLRADRASALCARSNAAGLTAEFRADPGLRLAQPSRQRPGQLSVPAVDVRPEGEAGLVGPDGPMLDIDRDRPPQVDPPGDPSGDAGLHGGGGSTLRLQQEGGQLPRLLQPHAAMAE